MPVAQALYHTFSSPPNWGQIIEAHFKIGESYVKIFLINFEKTGPRNEQQDVSESELTDLQKRNALPEISSGNAAQFFRHFSSNTCQNGARVAEVEEPLSGTKLALFEFEVDEVAEPKCLSSDQLRTLIQRCGSYVKTANSLGTSEAFIRQNTKQRNFKTKVRF